MTLDPQAFQPYTWQTLLRLLVRELDACAAFLYVEGWSDSMLASCDCILSEADRGHGREELDNAVRSWRSWVRTPMTGEVFAGDELAEAGEESVKQGTGEALHLVVESALQVKAAITVWRMARFSQEDRRYLEQSAAGILGELEQQRQVATL